MKLIFVILLSFVVTGCGFLNPFKRSEPIEVVTVEKERARLNIEMPPPLSISTSDWILVTPENVESVFEKLVADGKHPVLFAITSEGYEQLSFSMVNIRNYIATQRMILVQYQNYYEPPEEQQQ